MSDEGSQRALLLSGGLDSAAIACWLRPRFTLFIDYGQRPARAEARAASAIAQELGLEHHELAVDLSALGSGVLAGRAPATAAPSPEWWPFRNQLLATFAAAWTIRIRETLESPADQFIVTLGSVGPDGLRHADGSATFYRALDELLQRQEGGVRADAPALSMTTPELIRHSGIGDEALAWTHSCHRADIPCGDCPGCYKRADVLLDLGRLQ